MIKHTFMSRCFKLKEGLKSNLEKIEEEK